MYILIALSRFSNCSSFDYQKRVVHTFLGESSQRIFCSCDYQYACLQIDLLYHQSLLVGRRRLDQSSCFSTGYHNGVRKVGSKSRADPGLVATTAVQKSFDARLLSWSVAILRDYSNNETASMPGSSTGCLL